MKRKSIVKIGMILTVLALMTAACSIENNTKSPATEAAATKTSGEPATSDVQATKNTGDVQPTQQTNIANPASEFCVNQKGKLDIRTAADGGQSGYCMFDDGSECEEWSFFRGECKPGAQATATVEPAASDQNVDLSELQKLVLSEQKPDSYEGVKVIPVKSPSGFPPLWAAYTFGMKKYDMDPVPSHFIALYTHDAAQGWKQAEKIVLEDTTSQISADYVGEGSVQQVFVDETGVWFSVQAGLGAHSGVFEVVRYDGKHGSLEVVAASDSPGSSTLKDLNGDGKLEAITDETDAYVSCYACGVRKYQFGIYRWNAEAGKMERVELTSPSNAPENVREDETLAYKYAKVELWKDAAAELEKVKETLGKDPTQGNEIENWNAAMIQLHAEALKKAITESAYPIMANVFYGDYDAAVDLMKTTAPADIFKKDSPLVVGTPAENFLDSVSKYLVDNSKMAIEARPDLASAHFINAWGLYLANGDKVEIKNELQKAAELAPDQDFYKKSVEAVQ